MPLSKSKMRELKQQTRVKPKLENVKPKSFTPAILQAVLDPVKRKKLEKVYQELHRHGVDQEVRYGVYGPTFDIVNEIINLTHA